MPNKPELYPIPVKSSFLVAFLVLDFLPALSLFPYFRGVHDSFSFFFSTTTEILYRVFSGYYTHRSADHTIWPPIWLMILICRPYDHYHLFLYLGAVLDAFFFILCPQQLLGYSTHNFNWQTLRSGTVLTLIFLSLLHIQRIWVFLT